MARWLLAVWLAAGCAQLAGIDDTTGGGGFTLHVTAEYDGATVVQQPLDVTGQTATWFQPDAADPTTLDRFAGMQTDTDEWTATGPSGTPAIELTLPDVPVPFTHLVAAAPADVTVPELYYGDPSPQLPAADAAFDVNVTLPTAIAAGEQYEIDAVGAWALYGLGAAEAPVGALQIGPITVPYSSFLPNTPSPVAAITAADVVVLLRYTGDALTGVLQIPPFAQTDTGDALTGTLTEVTADQTLTATIDPATAATRYQALRPTMSGFGVSWGAYASPGASLDSGAGVLVAGGSPLATDTTLTAMYGNPFTSPSWPVVFEYVTSETRSYTAGGIPISLGAGLYTISDTSAGQTFSLPAGLPELISIDQTPLNTDGMAVTLAAGPVDVRFDADQPMNTSYELQLYDIVVTGTQATTTQVFDYVGPSADFTVPPELFVSGHTYVVRASCVQGGEPGFATGDLVSRSLPLSVGYFDSAVFTIQ
jgi:hypothetical protein